MKSFKHFINERSQNMQNKTLYVHRPLKNANDFVEWAKSQGLNPIHPEDMHCTIAYSKEPVNWNNIDVHNHDIIATGGNREIKALGENGKAIVLKFDSNELQHRWQDLKNKGCSYDFPEYISHVTISYDGTDKNIQEIDAYKGTLFFGAEVHKPLDLNWEPKKN